jgi:hypothetical protein
MSRQLISRSPDLQKLRDEGYDIEARGGYLLVKQVPYVNSRKEVKRGVLVATLRLAGEVTATPDTHVVHFAGDYPCDQTGAPLARIQHQSERKALDRDLIVDHSFSSKPRTGIYPNYYEQMTTYAAILSSHAEAIDPTATPRVFPLIEAEETESVFHYIDTASSRAGIGAVSRKLEIEKIAIIGLGGTGSYVLDLVAKTPVAEIHLFDGDVFSQHNAFRSPGAASLDDLRARPSKVSYLRARYSNMHRHIVAHDQYIDASNAEILRGMAFVFLCLDRGAAKKQIVEKLEEFGIPFIDVGMGIQLVDGALLGILRVTASTKDKRAHVRQSNRIPFSEAVADNDYAKNIQIADLNALNAALAVVKWKKLFGFYHDLENEHFSTYTIDGGALVHEDQL